MPAWRDQPVWRVLDTDFSGGARFLASWAAWEQDAHRPRILHYVAFSAQAPCASALLQALGGQPALAAQVRDFERQWQNLSHGFHRIELSTGRVLLTLCIGSLQALLREQEFVADALVIPHSTDDAGAPLWDRWCLKALVRLCRRGTTLEIATPTGALPNAVAEAGFVAADTSGAGTLHGSFQPRWEPASSRHHWRAPATPVSDCVVVGAGLAGAAAAAALARRGWTVTVLDAGPAPAAGASGLPVGLLAPQLSKDDGARARLTRAGVRMTHQWCHALLQQAADWAPCGVRQIQLDATPADALWHPTGAWIKPARLVAACLARPGVQFRGAAQVAQVAHHGDAWLLFDATGTVLARATQLVLAAAGGSVPLLETIQLSGVTGTSAPPRLRAMQLLGGQVSWGLHCAGDAAHFPSGPVNGHGSFVPDMPMDGARAWFAGATYETEANPGRDPQTGHLENWQRLARLLPTAAQRLTRRFERGEVHAWHGIRCATPDRLPAVGPVHADGMPPIWMSSAMGSRGLTYAVLSAELLAARLGGEPLPVEGRLARLLATTRPGLVTSDHL